MTLRTTCLSAIAAALLVAGMPAGVQANIEAGSLVCRSPGGVGYGVVSVLNLQCVYTSSAGGPEHHYIGVIRRYGLDLGVTQGLALDWLVFAPTGAIVQGDLAGVYGGLQGNASIGVGIGASALLGGSVNTFALQPLSAEGHFGLNVSAGVTSLELRSVDGPPGPVPGPRHAYCRRYQKC